MADLLQIIDSAPIQVVAGYKGTSEVRLAAEAGEVAGLCGLSWASAKSTWRKGLESGEAVVVLQNAPEPHPELPNVPLAINQAKTDEGKKLIQVGTHDASTITYLYALPPKTPKARVQTLRKAFADTMNDPGFLAEAKKANLDLKRLATNSMTESTLLGLRLRSVPERLHGSRDERREATRKRLMNRVLR